MDLIPTKRLSLHSKADAALGRGMDFALVVLAFLGIGYLLDRWFGTKPVFMIVLVVVALVGQFANMWYGYEARMKAFEAERAANTTGAGRPGKASAGKTSVS